MDQASPKSQSGKRDLSEDRMRSPLLGYRFCIVSEYANESGHQNERKTGCPY